MRSPSNRLVRILVSLALVLPGTPGRAQVACGIEEPDPTLEPLAIDFRFMQPAILSAPLPDGGARLSAILTPVEDLSGVDARGGPGTFDAGRDGLEIKVDLTGTQEIDGEEVSECISFVASSIQETPAGYRLDFSPEEAPDGRIPSALYTFRGELGVRVGGVPRADADPLNDAVEIQRDFRIKVGLTFNEVREEASGAVAVAVEAVSFGRTTGKLRARWLAASGDPVEVELDELPQFERVRLTHAFQAPGDRVGLELIAADGTVVASAETALPFAGPRKGVDLAVTDVGASLARADGQALLRATVQNLGTTPLFADDGGVVGVFRLDSPGDGEIRVLRDEVRVLSPGIPVELTATLDLSGNDPLPERVRGQVVLEGAGLQVDADAANNARPFDFEITSLTTPEAEDFASGGKLEVSRVEPRLTRPPRGEREGKLQVRLQLRNLGPKARAIEYRLGDDLLEAFASEGARFTSKKNKARHRGIRSGKETPPKNFKWSVPGEVLGRKFRGTLHADVTLVGPRGADASVETLDLPVEIDLSGLTP